MNYTKLLFFQLNILFKTLFSMKLLLAFMHFWFEFCCFLITIYIELQLKYFHINVLLLGSNDNTLITGVFNFLPKFYWQNIDFYLSIYFQFWTSCFWSKICKKIKEKKTESFVSSKLLAHSRFACRNIFLNILCNSFLFAHLIGVLNGRF